MNPLTMVAAVVVALILICIAQAVALIRQRFTIDRLRTKVVAAEIVTEKRRRTVREQAQMLVEMNDRNERLHADNRRMRERLPALAFDEDVTRPYIPDTGSISRDTRDLIARMTGGGLAGIEFNIPEDEAGDGR